MTADAETRRGSNGVRACTSIRIAPGQRWISRHGKSDLVIVKKSTLAPGRWMVRVAAHQFTTTITESGLIEHYQVHDSN